MSSDETEWLYKHGSCFIAHRDPYHILWTPSHNPVGGMEGFGETKEEAYKELFMIIKEATFRECNDNESH